MAKRLPAPAAPLPLDAYAAQFDGLCQNWDRESYRKVSRAV